MRCERRMVGNMDLTDVRRVDCFDDRWVQCDLLGSQVVIMMEAVHL